MNRPTLPPLDQFRHLGPVLQPIEKLGDLTGELAAVMATMVRSYEEVAQQYGFVCQGCEESCCRTLFYHHTYAEFALLEEGLQTLTAVDLEAVMRRSVEIQRPLSLGRGPAAAAPPRAMCPLNRNGRCILYAYRPMVCRLHGIPHQLRRPDGRIIDGPGCHHFDALCGGRMGPRLDRTPLYQRLAQVEQRFRQRVSAPIRLNMTLAEWLCARSSAPPPAF